MTGTPDLLLLEIGALAIGLLAGAFGALAGVGGGLVMVPLLTLVLDVPIQSSIAVSLLGVIAVSLSASVRYMAQGLVDRRVGLTLLLTTTLGGIIGGYSAGLVDGRVLMAAFGLLQLLVGLQMLRQQPRASDGAGVTDGEVSAVSTYHEPATGERVHYQPTRFGMGTGLSLFGGMISGLLGVGGGVVNVPVMTLLMRLPTRVALATSAYMLAPTAAASAVLYFSRGEVDTVVAAPVVLGVVAGAQVGSITASRVSQRTLQVVWAIVALVFAAQMLLRAATGG